MTPGYHSLCFWSLSPYLEVAAVTTEVAATITTTITIVTLVISVVYSNQAVSICDNGGGRSTGNHCHLP